jgi:hypothetical protein
MIRKVLLGSLFLFLLPFDLLAQWNTVDVGNSSQLTLFEHTGSSSPVPFNLRKTGYTGASVSYGILHLDMGHSTLGGGSNLHFRLQNLSGNYKEYAGLGAYIINNSTGNESGGLTFYTTENGSIRTRRMTILGNGNVGIGTSQPLTKLDVRGHFLLESDRNPIIYTGTGSQDLNRFLILLNSPNYTSASGLKAGGILVSDSYSYANPGKNDLIVKGSVGIGTSTPDYKLDVLGTIRARELKVDMQGADFVFEEDYNLRPIEEVEQFVKEKKHLPEIAPAKEMQEKGVNQSEMNQKLLQKIEELTLYLIEQKREIKELRKEIQTLKR